MSFPKILLLLLVSLAAASGWRIHLHKDEGQPIAHSIGSRLRNHRISFVGCYNDRAASITWSGFHRNLCACVHDHADGSGITRCYDALNADNARDLIRGGLGNVASSISVYPLSHRACIRTVHHPVHYAATASVGC